MNPSASDLGELTGVVTHEFNNILNTILLQLALLEQKKPPGEFLADIAVIREAARNAGSIIKKLQQFRQRCEPSTGPVDLHAVLEPLLRENFGSIAVVNHLAPSLPPVEGNKEDIARLMDLLLKSSVAALGLEAGTITIQAQASPDRVCLRLTDTGPQVSPEDLRHFFQPFEVLRHGSDGISVPLCKAIVRRLRGTIHAENRAEGGMEFVVELRVAAEPGA